MTPNGVIFVVFSSQLSALWCSVLLCWSSLTVHCTLISVSLFQVLLRSPTLFRSPALFTSPALLRGPVLFRSPALFRGPALFRSPLCAQAGNITHSLIVTVSQNKDIQMGRSPEITAKQQAFSADQEYSRYIVRDPR